MSEIKFSSHADPTKARVTGSVTVLDKDTPANVREFVEVVFDVVPKLVDLYIEGNASVRRKISDWFFSVDMDGLRDGGPVSEAHDCTMRKVGAFARRVICNACEYEFNVEQTHKMIKDLANKKEVKCSQCGYVVVGFV